MRESRGSLRFALLLVWLSCVLCVAALAAPPPGAAPSTACSTPSQAADAGFLAALGAAQPAPVLPELGKRAPASLCNNFCLAAHRACIQECSPPGCGGVQTFSCDNVTCDDVCVCVSPSC